MPFGVLRREPVGCFEYSFHYPATLDFAKLTSVDDADSVLYVTDSAFNGDVFSHLSSLAALEPLLAINAAPDWNTALVSVWNEVTKVSGLYCFFLSETLALLINQWMAGNFTTDTIVKPDAPKILDGVLRFFAHPPPNLEALREQRVATLSSLAALASIIAFAAHAADVDWKMYGTASVAGAEICFYDAKGIARTADGGVRVATEQNY
jgi:hypothetical protein